MRAARMIGLAQRARRFVDDLRRWRRQSCGYQFWTEHGEARTCALALRDHLDGAMDEPHQFGAKRPVT